MLLMWEVHAATYIEAFLTAIAHFMQDKNLIQYSFEANSVATVVTAVAVLVMAVTNNKSRYIDTMRSVLLDIITYHFLSHLYRTSRAQFKPIFIHCNILIMVYP